jgi:ribose 5-phosphate isomerase B
VLNRESRSCEPTLAPGDQPAGSAGLRAVAVASDHGGFALKEAVLAHLRAQGIPCRDFGPATADSCDYPDFALKVATAVAKGEAWRGIVVDGVGIGSSMAANKVPGIRAAVCFDTYSTNNARAHNDANVLCIGSRVLETSVAKELCVQFLGTEFEGGRHGRRVDKIMAIERTFTGGAR